MERFTLYSYQSLTELREIQEEHDVFPFIFRETKELLEENPDVCIDITTLVRYLNVNQGDCYSAFVNLRAMSHETKVIVLEALADLALSLFPSQFITSKPLIEKEDFSEGSAPTLLANQCRPQPIFIYHNTDELSIIVDYANTNNIPIATFSRATGTGRDEFENFNKASALALIDLTSASYAIEDNKNLIFSIETLLNAFPNIKVIVETSKLDIIQEYFPLYFNTHEHICCLLPELEGIEIHNEPVMSVRKITSLAPSELTSFISVFNYNLVGHHYFKERFRHAIKNFIALNKVDEQKVLSIFLFGLSGIGKTEVARLIADGMETGSYLPKINFQNYSSQDALNSLIGSPAGYVGCNHGELSEKVKKGTIGIILCDEFEKATRPVFSFFLELLEDGRFTDSMAREYDLNGYILVFTSNLKNKTEYERVIPIELQTRFDLVCEFQPPSATDRRKFINLLFEHAQNKFPDQFAKLTQLEIAQIQTSSYSEELSLREMKKAFNGYLMDLFERKGIID